MSMRRASATAVLLSRPAFFGIRVLADGPESFAKIPKALFVVAATYVAQTTIALAYCWRSSELEFNSQ